MMTSGKTWILLFSAALVMTALPVHGADIQMVIKRDIGVGHSAGAGTLATQGTLKAGSTVTVPEEFVAQSKSDPAKIDLRETLVRWVIQTPDGQIGPRMFEVGPGRQELFYPVKVAKASAGSRLGSHEMKWVALASLFRTGNLEVIAPPVAANVTPDAGAASRLESTPASTKVVYGKTYRGDLSETAAPCTDCQTAVPGIGSTLETVKDLKGIVNTQITPQTGAGRREPRADIETTVILRPTTLARRPACSNIIDDAGNIGAWGAEMAKILVEPRYLENFYKANALGTFCPKFSRLSPVMKTKAWLWFWAALAQEESGCQPDKEHATSYQDERGEWVRMNPYPGWGMWALEKNRHNRAWRGPSCYDIKTVRGQARCSIDTMNRTQLAPGRTASHFDETYWGPLTRAQRQIMPHMRRFQACF